MKAGTVHLTVDINGCLYDAEIMDSTHIRLRLAGGERWGIALHYGQLRRETVAQIKAAGYHAENGNWFIMPTGAR